MCVYCFDKEILSFETDKPFLALREEIEKKREEKNFIFLKRVIEEDSKPLFKIFGLKFIRKIGDTYNLFQCLKCEQYWMLSEPENAWRGYFKKTNKVKGE